MAPGTDRTIYLLCPANVRTGGPEALHQLGRVLCDLGHDARMVYAARELAPERSGDTLSFPEIADPMPADYAQYAMPRTTRVEDVPGNIIVFPELWPEVTRLVMRMTPHMWWLSIDNGMRAVAAFGGIAPLLATSCVHLCQSYYALAYLAERSMPALPLFDHTSPVHAAAARAASGERVARVLYPARGAWFTQWLRRWAPDLDWQELVGFTPAQVQSLFLTSRLYVDFGSHPGKDRMPREAAMLGCCVITGQRGAAGNPYDIPIPSRYKFRDSRLLVPRIARAIRTTLAEYDQRTADFAVYRRMIEGERAEFAAQAARIFGGTLVPAASPTP